ncbi:MAG: hypothetical protein EA384_01175 [Spirochaetaceae bacterium]|nr:MAG: hypothetical protein EA384_01175 [Spirochaetaceae bacterium]
MCRLMSLVAICCAVLVAGCAGVPQTQPPTLNLRRLSDQDSPLSLAVRSLEQISDARERAELANRIADAYIAQQRVGDALLLLDHAAGLAAFTRASAEAVAVAADTARLYRRIDREEEALLLLQETYDRAVAISASRERGDALDAVIDAGFEIGDEAIDLIGRAVESLFVLDDEAVRARLLTRTAVRFHQAGNRATMHTLMQQAIPAAGSVGNPWQRAAAISELAAAYEQTGNRDAAIAAIDEAVDELRRLGNGFVPSEDALHLLRTVDNVVLLAQQLSAVELVERLEQPEQRVAGLTSVAVGYGRQQARSAAYIFFSRAVREASLVEAAPARVAAMTGVAAGYLSAGDADLAVIQANGAASIVLQITDAGEQAEAARRVAAVYAAAGDSERALRLLNDLPAGAVRDSVRVAYARELAHHGNAVEARQALVEAFPEPSADGGSVPAAEVALAFAEARDTERALGWLTAASDIIDVVRVLVVLGLQGVGAAELSEAGRATLAQLRISLAAR